jgi:hypothetical protein
VAQKEGEKEMIDPHSYPEVEGAIVFDHCDSAIIGYGSQHGHDAVIIYDYELLVAQFIEDGMTEEESMEYVDFNIAGAWLGDRTPIIFHRFPV